ncbi:MAG: YitT family protein, partial [Lachnospiraceae bacterium]
FTLKSIYDPNNLVAGGFTGIAIIVKAVTQGMIEGGVPLWLTNALLNVPVFLIGFKIKGKEFIGKTLLATVALSAWLYVMPSYILIPDNLFLASVFGGAIQGVGIGLVFITQATTGGTDMVGAIIQHYMKHVSVARLMTIIDAVVVTVGGFVFGIEKALYAVISIVVINKVADALIEGLKFAKASYIITNKHQEVAKAVMERLDRGVTGIYAKGMYTDQDRYILFCVVTKKELVQLKEIVGEIDENAFVIVSDAREVLGEGFLPVG